MIKPSYLPFIKIGAMALVALTVLLFLDLPVINEINKTYKALSAEEKDLSARLSGSSSLADARLSLEAYSGQIPDCAELFKSEGSELELIYDLEKMAGKHALEQKLNLSSSQAPENGNLIKLPLIIELKGGFKNLVGYLDELEQMKLRLKVSAVDFTTKEDGSLQTKLLANTYWLKKETANCD